MLTDQRPSNARAHCYPISQLRAAIEAAMDEPPARRPNSFIGGPYTVVVPSTGGESHELEGRPAGALSVILRFTPAIAKLKFEPFKVWIFDGQRVRTYTPDFLFFTKNGHSVLGEIKPAAYFFRPDVKRLVDSMTQACREIGVEFRTYNAEQLEEQPRLNNLRLLLSHSRDSNAALPSLLRILRHARRPMALAALQKINPAIDAGAVSAGLRLGVIGSSHRFQFGPSFNVFLTGDHHV